MTIESASFVNQLNSAYPAVGDPKSEGDDHLRLLKAVLLATFPNLSSVINATPAELNALLGAATTGATIKVATQAATDSSLNAASTAMVQLAILAASGITAVLPGQASNANKFLTTDGTSASWSFGAWKLKTSAYTAIAGDQIRASTTGGAWSLQFPASPNDGDIIRVQDVDGTFMTNNLTIDPNGKTVMGLTSMICNTQYMDWVFTYYATSGDWKL